MAGRIVLSQHISLTADQRIVELLTAELRGGI